MAYYDKAIKLLLPQDTPGALGDEEPGGRGSENIIPCLFILHTNGGNMTGPAAYAYWKDPVRADGKEANFQLETSRYPGLGRLFQMMSTTRRADSTGAANAFWRNGKRYGAISLESADYGSPWELNWTQLGQRQQVEDLLVWACQTHGIEPVLAYRHPAGGWNGIGYHNQLEFHDEWNKNSHVCPGVGKIAEIPDIIATVARRLAQPPEDDSMSAADVADLKTWMAAELGPRLQIHKTANSPLGGGSLEACIQEMRTIIRAIGAGGANDANQSDIAAIKAQLTELQEAVAKLAPPTG